jgi:hypothetical protein
MQLIRRLNITYQCPILLLSPEQLRKRFWLLRETGWVDLLLPTCLNGFWDQWISVKWRWLNGSEVEAGLEPMVRRQVLFDLE